MVRSDVVAENRSLVLRMPVCSYVLNAGSGRYVDTPMH